VSGDLEEGVRPENPAHAVAGHPRPGSKESAPGRERALRRDTGALKKPVADLLAAKKLRTTGAKGGTPNPYRLLCTNSREALVSLTHNSRS
jgi:hypothetical protein